MIKVNTIKILIVDDKVENLISLENILLESDVMVFKALSGLEALELLLVLILTIVLYFLSP